jgi:hypothetical protein
MYSTFRQEMAQDRQSQLLRDAGVDGSAAPLLARMKAGERAEAAATRPRRNTFNLAGRLTVALAARRSSRLGLSGV